MSLERFDDASLHTPPLCGENEKPMFLLTERDFAIMGDEDVVHRVCPFTGAPITVKAEILGGDMTYTYQCKRCDLYSIES